MSLLTVEQFGQWVRELATKAFADVPGDVFEMLAREAFFKGCTNVSAGCLAMLRDPKTLSEALSCTRNITYNDRLLANRRCFSSNCQPVQVRREGLLQQMASKKNSLRNLGKLCFLHPMMAVWWCRSL